MAGGDRNRGKIFVVQLVGLAAESRKEYIPSPLKRWYGIGAQPLLSYRSILCDCFNIMIQIILKVIKQAKVLCTLCDNAVIQLKYVGCESTARKS